MKTLEHAEDVLGQKLSRAHVRDLRGNSYVEGHYVVQKLNEAFGPLGWDLDVVRLECTTGGAYEDPNPKKKGQFRVGYMAVVRITAFSGDIYRTTKVDVGHGDGIGKDLAAIHESAVKEAVTDGLKRAARHLGMAMGLALYDKNQTNVVDASPEDIRHMIDCGLLEDASEALKKLPRDTEEQSAIKDALIAEFKAARA